MRVRTAGKLGYCFGVSQAIEKAISFAKAHGTVYSLGTLAHNEVVVDYLKEHDVLPGAEDYAPEGGNVAITAHGAAPQVYRNLEGLGCQVLDCTCPIVKRAQKVVSGKLKGFDIVIYGDPAHQEVKSLDAWAGGAKFIGSFNDLFTPEQDFKNLKLSKKIGIVSQTTRIPSAFADFVATLINRNIEGLEEVRVINTICPIVAQRIRDTRQLAGEVDIMLVVGSKESANTLNLSYVANQGVGTHHVHIVQGPEQVSRVLSDWFNDEDAFAEMGLRAGGNGGRALPRVGVTAGTSTPIEVVERVVEVVEKVTERIEGRINGSRDSD